MARCGGFQRRMSALIFSIQRMSRQAIMARRTANMVATSYWWYGLSRDAKALVASCQICSRTGATFGAHHPILTPLPIEGMFYRWGVDLCGPFTKTAGNNRFIMIAIEHFSKHMEVIPLPSKLASTTASAFLQHVLGRFGACAETVTDRGSEFMGEFHALLQQALIDHRMTSANHPQADGLSERAVQTVKKALHKRILMRVKGEDWDAALPSIALGYCCSEQESTGFSPYILMYGHHPIIPPAVAERCQAPISLMLSRWNSLQMPSLSEGSCWHAVVPSPWTTLKPPSTVTHCITPRREVAHICPDCGGMTWAIMCT
jgi:transposase InsO family protein